MSLIAALVLSTVQGLSHTVGCHWMPASCQLVGNDCKLFTGCQRLYDYQPFMGCLLLSAHEQLTVQEQSVSHGLPATHALSVSCQEAVSCSRLSGNDQPVV